MDGCSTNSNNIFSRTPTDASGWMKKFKEKRLKSGTKAVRLALSHLPPLFNVGCKFPVHFWSLLSRMVFSGFAQH